MRILVLAGITPNEPHDGDKLRLHHFLRQLKRRGHRVDLFCLTREKAETSAGFDWKDLADRVHLQHLDDREMCLNLAGGLLAGMSWNVSAYHSPHFRQALGAHAASQEGRVTGAVLAYRLRMVPYAEFFLKARSAGHPEVRPIPWVLDYTDCMTNYTRQAARQSGIPWSRRAVAWWDAPLLADEERHAALAADACLAVSEGEREELIRLGAPADKITVVPNGVPKAAKGRRLRPDLYPAKTPVAAFVGNLGYAPNEDGVRWFIEKVWPTVRAIVPDAVFCAVGGSPRPDLLALDNGRDIRVRGFVPDLVPYLSHATCTVAPLRVAAGFQNKIALSLIQGVPVVATPQALRWLPKAARGGVRESENPIDFAHHVADLLFQLEGDASKARRSGAALRRLYSWEVSGKKLDALLRKLAVQKRVSNK